MAQLLTSPPSTAPSLSQPHLDYNVTPAALVGGLAGDHGPQDGGQPWLRFRHHGLRRRGGEGRGRAQRHRNRRPRGALQNRQRRRRRGISGQRVGGSRC